MSKENEYLEITNDFLKEYLATSIDIGTGILAGRIISKKLIGEKIIKYILPIIDDLFSNAIHESNKIVPIYISKLANDLDLPFKYNKDMLQNINDKSIFTGWYDKDGKTLFSKREILNLKSIILKAKYSNWTEAELVVGIRNIVKVTKKNALLIGRTETTRIKSVANKIYFGSKKVQDEYDLVWQHNSDYDRHKMMSGIVANSDGMFLSPKDGLVPGPPYIESPWNCLCTTYFRKKE